MSTKKDHPFASLEQLRGKLPPGTPPPAPPPRAIVSGPARAVIRVERKQRGGKEVTVIEKLGLPAKELEAWCRALKQALGCGGAVEDDAIVLQGDLKQRLPAVLEARGVQRVTVG